MVHIVKNFDRKQWLVWRSWKLSNNMAWLYLSQKKPKQALTYSANAMALNPANEQLNLMNAKIRSALEVNE